MIDIYDPDLYTKGPPHEIFEELRKTNPVYYQEMPDEPGYFAVLTHKDCVKVSKEPNLFSSAKEGIVLENLDEGSLKNMRNMLLGMDPPRHTDWRKGVSGNFKMRVISAMDEQIRTITKNIFKTALLEKGKTEEGKTNETLTLDFVHDICAYLPSNVMGELMDIPKSDRPQIHKWSEMQAGGQDSELNPNYENSVSSASLDMLVYGMEHAKKHRANPKEGVTELVLATDVDGKSMTDEDFGCFFLQLVTAGNDTTRTMLASGTWALLRHPDILSELRNDYSLIPSAVEEILRWENPLHYFRRTTTKDIELSGVKIKAGEKVAIIYTSANRDETVFEDPHKFDIHRNPNPHLSFGIGEHFCLGVHLARLEGKIFFEELFSLFSEIEQVGDARRIRSNLNNSIKELPVKLTVGN